MMVRVLFLFLIASWISCVNQRSKNMLGNTDSKQKELEENKKFHMKKVKEINSELYKNKILKKLENSKEFYDKSNNKEIISCIRSYNKCCLRNVGYKCYPRRFSNKGKIPNDLVDYNEDIKCCISFRSYLCGVFTCPALSISMVNSGFLFSNKMFYCFLGPWVTSCLCTFESLISAYIYSKHPDPYLFEGDKDSVLLTINEKLEGERL